MNSDDFDAEIKFRCYSQDKEHIQAIARARGRGTKISDIVREAIDLYLHPEKEKKPPLKSRKPPGPEKDPPIPIFDHLKSTGNFGEPPPPAAKKAERKRKKKSG